MAPGGGEGQYLVRSPRTGGVYKRRLVPTLVKPLVHHPGDLGREGNGREGKGGPAHSSNTRQLKTGSFLLRLCSHERGFCCSPPRWFMLKRGPYLRIRCLSPAVQNKPGKGGV